MSGIETVRDGGVLVATLNRPEVLNALSDEMIVELIETLDIADRDDDVRSVVIAGRGRAFCAGADLAAGDGALDRRLPDEPYPRDRIGRLALRIYASAKPVLGAITGHAVGAGLTFTLPMDVRVVAEGAKLGFVFTRRGITPEGCSTWFLPRLVGHATAVDWMCSGRMFGPDEAVSAGLAVAAVPAAEVLSTTMRLARSMSEHSAPVAAATTLRLLRQMASAQSPLSAHVAESVALAELGGSSDAKEGVRAFLERREPRFAGRLSRDAPSPVGDVVPEWARELEYGGRLNHNDECHSKRDT